MSRASVAIDRVLLRVSKRSRKDPSMEELDRSCNYLSSIYRMTTDDGVCWHPGTGVDAPN